MGLLRKIRQRCEGPAVGLILLYHRVVDIASDPQELCVTPRHFAEHLDVLRRHGELVSLGELVSGRAAAAGRPRLVVTFDDGYIDNLREAKPLLRRHDTPATVFVATGHLTRPREFWWDELERLVLLPGQVRGDLALRLPRGEVACRLPGAEHYSSQDYERHRRWTMLSTTDPTPRHSLYRTLCAQLRGLPWEARLEALEQIRDWTGQPVDGRETHRVMTPDEVCELAADQLVEIGAHTVNHPVLSSHPREVQDAEICESKRRLEEILGRPVVSFSYPFGTRRDFNAQSVRAVRQAGFACSCANEQGAVRRRSDIFRLRRRVVRDWDGDTLARHLEDWLGEP